jgi:hypothetical protein
MNLEELYRPRELSDAKRVTRRACDRRQMQFDAA